MNLLLLSLITATAAILIGACITPLPLRPESGKEEGKPNLHIHYYRCEPVPPEREDPPEET